MACHQLHRKLKEFANDKKGSETVEMVVSTAVMLVFILVAVMMLSYFIQYNNVIFATKRVARNIEVTGMAPQSEMNSMFTRMMGGNTQMVHPKISISNVSFKNPSKATIQLKSTFRLTASVDYIIPLINPGSFTNLSIKLPIAVSVTGMSEVYWPLGS